MQYDTATQLGELDGTLLVFGGPYSNLAATQAMLQQADSLGIDARHTICTGDVVAYGAEAEQTSQLIIDSGIHVVLGNCEESLANDADDCGCGFDSGMTCSVLSQKWYRYANRQVSTHTRQWMRKLPRSIRFSFGGVRFRVIHGGVSRINRFIFSSTASSLKTQEIQQAGCDVVIGGHCGLPFGETLETGAWLNAGVIGLPANDGTTSGWYLLLQTSDTGIQCHWQRLDYEYQLSHQSMLTAGLNDYADAVISGRWPSMDILPEQERQRQGQRIEPFSLTLPHR